MRAMQIWTKRAFVQEKRLLTLPARANLQVIPTLNSCADLAVGGFNSGPRARAAARRFYWVTPIPASWPKHVESKLREYNF